MKFEILPILNLKRNFATSILLVIDEKLNILLDCGINQKLDFERYLNYAAKLQNIDIILLSHSSIEYCGALPFLLDILNIKPKIYTTFPIIELGQVNLFDSIINLVLFQETQPIDCKSICSKIAQSYEKCQPLKYLQKQVVDMPHKIKGKPIVITPFGIGNTVGACAWKIQCELVNILYLTSYNNYKEYHVDSIDLANLEKRRYDIVITDSIYDQAVQDVGTTQQQIENELVQALEKQSQKKTGNILILTYPNERVIEILFMFHKICQEIPKFSQKKIELFHNNKKFLDLYKKKFNEFMSKNIDNLIQSNKSNIFNDNNIQVTTSINSDPIDNNRIILTTYNAVFIGPLFNFWQQQVSNENNTVIVVGSPQIHQKEPINLLSFSSQQLFVFQKYFINIQNQPEIQKYIYSSSEQQQANSKNSAQEKSTKPIQVKIEPENENKLKVEHNPQDSKMEIEAKQEDQRHEESKQLNESSKALQQQQQSVQNGTADTNDPDQETKQEQNLINIQVAQEEGNVSDQHPQEENTKQKKKTKGQKNLQHQEFERQQVLFARKDFPRFNYQELKQKQCIYGTIIDNVELQKFNQINEEILNLYKQQNTKKPIVSQNYLINKRLQDYHDILKEQQGKINKIQFEIKNKMIDIPLTGYTDLESAINILQVLRPKQIVLINGLENEKLKDSLEKLTSIYQWQIKQVVPSESTEIIVDNESINIKNYTFEEEEKAMNQKSYLKVKAKLKVEYDTLSKNVAMQLDLCKAAQLENCDDRYQFYGNVQLKNIMDYFIKHNKKCIIKDGLLNFNDRIFIKKNAQNYQIEGIYSQEYKEIRNLLYQTLNSQN